MGRVGDGLGVIDDGGSAVQANHGGEGRADARDAAFAFERFHQRRLFAYLVRACAGLGDNVEVEAWVAEDVLAQEALGVSIRDSLLHNVEKVAILAAQVDEAHLRADGEAGDHCAFDHRMRIFAEEDVVLAGAGLGLVAVDQNILGLGRSLGHERPLHPHGEARAAAPAQAARLHGVDDPRLHLFALGNGILHGFVAVQLDVFLDAGRALAEAPREHLDFIGMGDQTRHYFPSFLV